MRNTVSLLIISTIFSLTTIGQKLNITDLIKLKQTNLNNAETILSQKKFDFVDFEESTHGKGYNFAYNLDNFGNLADEFISLTYKELSDKPWFVWYQLKKEGWLKLKNNLLASGYKKLRQKLIQMVLYQLNTLTPNIHLFLIQVEVPKMMVKLSTV